MKELDDETYKFVFSNCIRLCVDLIIPYNGGVLVGKRAHEPFKGIYALPGGGMKFGESVNAAAHRIASKELNLIVGKTHIFDIIEFPEEIELANRHSISIAVVTDVTKVVSLGPTYAFEGIASSKDLKPSQILDKHRKVINRFLT